MSETFFRSSISLGIADKYGVDRSAKVIRGFSVLTKGEAQGHGLWLDDDFMNATMAHGAAAPEGLKSRFTHPAFEDGLGTYLGRTKFLRRDGAGMIRGDLHLAEAASSSPKGDLAKYVMDLAEQDPAAFGASIVFGRDRQSESAFLSKNSSAGEFRSPDRANLKNLLHARMSTLNGCDIVDSPAANPGGLFSARRSSQLEHFSRGTQPAQTPQNEELNELRQEIVADRELKTGTDFISEAKRLAKRENLPLHEAMSKLSKINPELYERQRIINAKAPRQWQARGKGR